MLNHSGRKNCVRNSTYTLFIVTNRLFSNRSKNNSYMMSVGWKLRLSFTPSFFLCFSFLDVPFTLFLSFLLLPFSFPFSFTASLFLHSILSSLSLYTTFVFHLLFYYSLLLYLPTLIYLFIRHSCSFFLSYNIDKLWNTNSIDRRRVLCPSCLCTRRWRVGVWKGINTT